MENRKLKALDLFHMKMNFLGSKLVRYLLTLGEICFPKILQQVKTTSLSSQASSVGVGDQSLVLSASTSLWQGLLLSLAREPQKNH